ncbi:MAG TPA: polysaccharide biosynthesis/export family protein [Phycisphaerae bacterium]|nr:polysaccharide biosynthesis/export family protein [Phycisphaerae bacterium]
MMSKSNLTKCVTVFAAILAMPACARTGQRVPAVAAFEPPELYQPFVGGAGLPEQLMNRPPYRLAPGDVLEIIYQVRNVPSDSPYELKIEDIIQIAFPYQNQFNQRLTVQGDGNIRCLLVGQVRAAGRTAGDLEDQLRHAYARYLKEPELTVVVEAANVKIVELKKAITTAPRGQSRLVPIKPDGTIDLPYIGEALVAGKTVNEAKKLLDARYAEEDLQEVEVTVQTLEFAPKRIFVMGEVQMPGGFESVAPITLLQALIRQGGPTARAMRSKIMLLRRQHLPIPQAIIFDLETLLHAQKPTEYGAAPDASLFRYDSYLVDGDIIYVPPTALAVANDWIDQVFTRGIRAVFPYNGYVGVNFGYQMYNAPSSFRTKNADQPFINSPVTP